MKSRKHLIQFTNKFQGFNLNNMQLLGKKKNPDRTFIFTASMLNLYQLT